MSNVIDKQTIIYVITLLSSVLYNTEDEFYE